MTDLPASQPTFAVAAPLTQHLPNLDLLRAIAVTAVVADHVALASRHLWIGPFSAEWLGTAGVFLFFVHTALVLLRSLERRPNTLDFYIRRLFRIYPLAMLATLFAVATRAPVSGNSTNWFVRAPLNPLLVLANLLLVQTLYDVRSVLNVLWSLPLELQMYVLLPTLWFAMQRQRRLWTLLVLWGLAVAFATSAFPKTAMNLAVAIPLFLPGVMAYHGFESWRPRLPGWMFPPALLAALAAFVARPSQRLGWVLALAVGLGLPLFRQITARWAKVLSQKVAQYSYGVYLSHPFALVVGFYGLRGRPFAVELGVTLLLTAVASVAAYHLVEKPLIDAGARVARRVAG